LKSTGTIRNWPCLQGCIAYASAGERNDPSDIQDVGEGRKESRRQAGRPIRFGSSSGGAPIELDKWIRWIHRSLSIAFAVAVIVNIVALRQGEPAIWVGLLALFPLALLLLTGLYLFVLPHATRWRSG
jgi:hypothetical protein